MSLLDFLKAGESFLENGFEADSHNTFVFRQFTRPNHPEIQQNLVDSGIRPHDLEEVYSKITNAVSDNPSTSIDFGNGEEHRTEIFMLPYYEAQQNPNAPDLSGIYDGLNEQIKGGNITTYGQVINYLQDPGNGSAAAHYISTTHSLSLGGLRGYENQNIVYAEIRQTLQQEISALEQTPSASNDYQVSETLSALAEIDGITNHQIPNEFSSIDHQNKVVGDLQTAMAKLEVSLIDDGLDPTVVNGIMNDFRNALDDKEQDLNTWGGQETFTIKDNQDHIRDLNHAIQNTAQKLEGLGYDPASVGIDPSVPASNQEHDYSNSFIWAPSTGDVSP